MDEEAVRITPAGAGKTQSDRPAAGPCTDHPRRCGENQLGTSVASALGGITPAGAGKTDIP